jgi:hypothetical protein
MRNVGTQYPKKEGEILLQENPKKKKTSETG